MKMLSVDYRSENVSKILNYIKKIHVHRVAALKSLEFIHFPYD
ncbi:MAG: hypothetical protein Tsb0018_08530 [Opitutales bacterium]